MILIVGGLGAGKRDFAHGLYSLVANGFQTLCPEEQ